MTNLEEEIKNSASRMISLAEGWYENPRATAETSSQMQSLSGHLLATASKIDAELSPPVFDWPERDLENLTPWDTGYNYGMDIRDETVDMKGATASGAKSAVALIRGSGTLKKGKLTQSGGDGIKVLNGSDGATIEDVHIYGIGHKPGAHADALQITGGVSNLIIRKMVADIPNNDHSPGASPVVNAGLIISSQDSPNGRIDVYDSDFYGGTYVIYNISKNSGNAIADLHFHNTRFHIGLGIPQFGLFQCEAKPTFHGTCQVIDHGTGEVLSSDPWGWSR